jgi:hypothetical protein
MIFVKELSSSAPLEHATAICAEDVNVIGGWGHWADAVGDEVVVAWRGSFYNDRLIMYLCHTRNSKNRNLIVNGLFPRRIESIPIECRMNHQNHQNPSQAIFLEQTTTSKVAQDGTEIKPRINRSSNTLIIFASSK